MFAGEVVHLDYGQRHARSWAPKPGRVRIHGTTQRRPAESFTLKPTSDVDDLIVERAPGRLWRCDIEPGADRVAGPDGRHAVARRRVLPQVPETRARRRSKTPPPRRRRRPTPMTSIVRRRPRSPGDVPRPPAQDGKIEYRCTICWTTVPTADFIRHAQAYAVGSQGT